MLLTLLLTLLLLLLAPTRPRRSPLINTIQSLDCTARTLGRSLITLALASHTSIAALLSRRRSSAIHPLKCQRTVESYAAEGIHGAEVEGVKGGSGSGKCELPSALYEL